MAPPTKESAATNTPPHVDPAEVGAVAVRSDHWKTLIDFLFVQSSVLNAAVPRHMYGLQAEAHRRYKVLEPMLDKYEFPNDMVEVTVTLNNGERQKVRISQEALTAGVDLDEGSKVSDTVTGKKSVENENDVVDNDAVQQPRASIKEEWKPPEKTPKMSNTQPNGSDTAKLSGSRTSVQSNVPKPATSKRAASASQATAESSDETSRRESSKTKQKAAYDSSLYKPRIAAATSATKSDMCKTSEKPTRIRVVPPKKSNPFQISEVLEPKLATRKISENSNTSEPGKAVKSESPSSTFLHHGSHVQNSFVRLDTPPKPTKASDASNTYSETATSVGRKAAHAGTKIDDGAHAVLKVKTNKNKAPPKDNTKASKNTDVPSQSSKSVIKPKVMSVDGKVIAADSKPATNKRPRSCDDVHVNDRPSKKLATKQTPAFNTGRNQTETKYDEDTSPDSLSSPNEAEKTYARMSTCDVDIKLDISRKGEASPASVATTDSGEIEQTKATPTSNHPNPTAECANKCAASIKPDEAATGIPEALAAKACSSSIDVNTEADDGHTTNISTSSEPTSARANGSSAKRDSKTTKTAHNTFLSTPNPTRASGQQKGITRVIKKGRKRTRDRADDFINDYSGEEDASPNRKAKKAKHSLDEENHDQKSVAGFEETDEDSTHAFPGPRTAEKSNARSRSHTGSAESRSSEEADQKYKHMSLADENFKAGRALATLRSRRTLSSASSIGSTASPPSRSSSSSKKPKTPTSSTTPDSSVASNSSSASPRRTRTTPESVTSAPAKRKRDDSTSDSRPSRKRKATPHERVVSTATPRPPLEQVQSAEAKMKKLIEERTGKAPVNYSAMKWQQKEG